MQKIRITLFHEGNKNHTITKKAPACQKNELFTKHKKNVNIAAICGGEQAKSVFSFHISVLIPPTIKHKTGNVLSLKCNKIPKVFFTSQSMHTLLYVIKLRHYKDQLINAV